MIGRGQDEISSLIFSAVFYETSTDYASVWNDVFTGAPDVPRQERGVTMNVNVSPGLESVFRKQIKRLAVCAFNAIDEIHMAVPDVLDALLRPRIFLQAIHADLEVCRFRRCKCGKGCRCNYYFIHTLYLSSGEDSIHNPTLDSNVKEV